MELKKNGQAQNTSMQNIHSARWCVHFLVSVSKRVIFPTMTPRCCCRCTGVNDTNSSCGCGVSVVVGDNNFLILIIIPLLHSSVSSCLCLLSEALRTTLNLNPMSCWRQDCANFQHKFESWVQTWNIDLRVLLFSSYSKNREFYHEIQIMSNLDFLFRVKNLLPLFLLIPLMLN